MTTIATILQLLIAVAFLSMPVVRHRYGDASQTAAQAELERQGAPASPLDDVNFGGRGIETAIPAAVAAILYSQLTAAKSLRAWLDRKDDPAVQRIDVHALLEARPVSPTRAG